MIRPTMSHAVDKQHLHELISVYATHLESQVAELEEEKSLIALDDRQLVYLTVDDLERIKLEQQAKGRLDGVAYALNMYCTAMSPKEFPPIGAYYASQLQDKTLKVGV